MDAHLLPGSDRNLVEHRSLWGDPATPGGSARDALAGSGLRCRDGSGANAFLRWTAACTNDAEVPTSLVATVVDAEPCSVRERAVAWRNPFGVIGGLVSAGVALNVTEAFVALADDEPTLYERFTDALAEAELAGWLEHVSVKTVRVSPHHLGVEPRAMVELLDGRAAMPRRSSPEVIDPAWAEIGRPGPEPATVPGSFDGRAVVIDSAETFAYVCPILARGPAWFAAHGTQVSPGRSVVTVTGHVDHPVVSETELGPSFPEMLAELGVTANAEIVGVLPGVSSAILTRSRLAAPLSPEGLAAVGASFGHGAFVVLCDETTMPLVAAQAARLLRDAACTQCPACHHGTAEVVDYLDRINVGPADPDDLNAVVRRLADIEDRHRCELPVRFRSVVGSWLRAYPPTAEHAAMRRFQEGRSGRVAADAGLVRRLRLDEFVPLA